VRAISKLDAALSPEMLAFARQLDAVFVGEQFGAPGYGDQDGAPEALREAIMEGRSVELRYRSQRGTVTERRVGPYNFWFHRGVLYLVGWCHLRQEVRIFSMARVLELSVTDQRFQADPSFDFESFRKARFRTWAEGVDPRSTHFNGAAARRPRRCDRQQLGLGIVAQGVEPGQTRRRVPVVCWERDGHGHLLALPQRGGVCPHQAQAA